MKTGQRKQIKARKKTKTKRASRLKEKLPVEECGVCAQGFDDEGNLNSCKGCGREYCEGCSSPVDDICIDCVNLEEDER
jgi:membrane protease subunit (stomatin/prohibitin family)